VKAQTLLQQTGINDEAKTLGPQQLPLQQGLSPGQTWPHAPQFLLSVFRLAQVPPQPVWPAGQHAPFVQVVPLPQTLPHAPQLFTSALVKMQTLLQQSGINDEAKVLGPQQLPLQQGLSIGHTLPHAPQLLLLVFRSTQTPAQSV
jgi:hypothetical protein